MGEHIGFKFVVGAFLYLIALSMISMCSSIQEMRWAITRISYQSTTHPGDRP